MGIYGTAAYSAVIRENTFTGNAQLTFSQLQQSGVVLWNGLATTALKGHNLVEDNLFLRLPNPIAMSGSGRAPNNVIRSNRILRRHSLGPDGLLTTAYTAIK